MNTFEWICPVLNIWDTSETILFLSSSILGNVSNVKNVYMEKIKMKLEII